MRNAPLALGPLFFSSLVSVVAQTAYPTPVDTNDNGRIDSAEIQAVIDAAPGTGPWTILLPAARTYRIDTPVVLNADNVTLLGEGHGVSTSGGTILRIVGDIEGFVVGHCTGSGLRHLSVTGTSGHAQNAIRLQSAANAFVEDVRIANTYRGVEIVDCTAPVLRDVALRGQTGDYGFHLRGDDGATTQAELIRISGASEDNHTIEWLLMGAHVDGVVVRSTRFVGGGRGLRFTGSPGPANITLYRFGSDHARLDSARLDSGSGLTMINSWLGQPDGAGFVLDSGFTGNAELTNLRIRGAGLHGLEIAGGTGIDIRNPLIGANGTAYAAGSATGAGIKVAAGVTALLVSGGRVGPLYSQGSGAQQCYGVLYTGTTGQSDSDHVKLRGVSTAGNAVPSSPSGLIAP